MNEKGRWFRVYARQVEDHEKFRDMSGLELGAWLALRSAAELRDRAVIRDRTEAVIILRRRRIPKPATMLDGLIERRLFDVDERGRITVHDRADHDRPAYPSDEPERVAERVRKHRETTSNDSLQKSNDTHAGVQPQPPAPATANSPSMQPDVLGLPADDDSATEACRLFLNGGRWLSDAEYVAAWEDMDHRYTKAWVSDEMRPAYLELHLANPKVKPWDLVHKTEFRLAERARAEDRAREEQVARAAQAEADRLRLKAESATEEEKERATIMRRAVGLWMKKQPGEPVPTDFDELAGWLERQEAA